MVSWINVKLIQHNIDNPRYRITTDDLEKSMASEGFKEEFPLVVRPIEDAKFKYRIVEGDRRLKSAIRVGIPEVPVIIRKIDEKNAFIETIKENILRENFEPMEEAKAFLKLKSDFGMNNTQIASSLCKTEAFVRNRLDLLNLDEEIQKLVGKVGQEGRIPSKKAEFISEIENKEIQKILAQKTLTEDINQNELKRLVDRVKKVQDVDKAKKIISVKQDRLSMLADKFKKSDLFKVIKKEKKEKKSEEQKASNDFLKYMSDLSSWSSMLVSSAIEISSNLDKYDLKELYKLSDDKKTLKKYIKELVGNKERIIKFYNSDFYERMKKAV